MLLEPEEQILTAYSLYTLVKMTVSSIQLSQDGRASVLQTMDGMVECVSLSVKRKSCKSVDSY